MRARRIDRSLFAVIYNHGEANRRRASRDVVEYVPEAFYASLTTEWPRHVDVYDRLFYPLHIPSFVYLGTRRSEETHGESPTRSHASTLIPVLSRPVASLGHPVLQMTLKGLPRLLHLFFVLPFSRPLALPIVLSLSYYYLSSLSLSLCPATRSGDATNLLWLLRAGVYLQLVAESIRRNVALTGSYERHGKNRQASHKHLWVSYRR